MATHSPVWVAIGIAVLTFSPRARATDFYVDPAKGKIANDGSKASPWSTIEEVVKGGKLGGTVHAGDTVWLLSGYHGELVIGSGAYAQPITLAALPGEKPQVRHVQIRGTTGVTVRGLSVSPSYAPPYAKVTLVEVSGTSSGVIVEDCDAFSVADSSAWKATDWVNVASNGAEIGGTGIVLRHNTFTNVRFGISATGKDALIERNSVVNFSADGLRGLGDGEVFQYNVVKNSYVGPPDDDNHDDGFQSWSVGSDGQVGTGEVHGIVLRGNTLINYEDPNQPFRTSMQGVGCFDGTFVDWVVENNVVITDHWHGITFLGARNVHVVNNTIIDPNNVDPGPPWIEVDAHKDGTAPTGCIVRNNLVTDLNDAKTGVTEDHNTVLTDNLASFFVNAPKYDLHLLETAPAVNAGSSDLAPRADLEGVPRPQGAGVDQGAYEWHDATVIVDAGAGGGGGGANASGGGAAAIGGAGNSRGGDSSSGGGGATGALPGRDAGIPPDASTATGSAASQDDSGCGCRVSSHQGTPSVTLSVLALSLLLRRRRSERRAKLPSRCDARQLG